MAKRPPPPPEETAVLLQRELRARGMSDAEIEAATRKKKRRRVLAFNAVQSRHLAEHDINYRPAHAARSDDACTVEEAAQRLQLHPKTVLRLIKEGRLRGTRIGKSYRILRTDSAAFVGAPPQVIAARIEDVSVTSIVDIPGVTDQQAQTWATRVTSALAGQRGASPLRADVVYDPARSHLKIYVVGPPSDAVNLLALIRVWLEQGPT